ncbi:MAG: type I restriction enzyme HsdR N-terminal domain-containing protein [Proteobacteria bacterium]|nr:type I restriction enzyme HsdR N-terminal domain-containing protein [Pseudomonadota bacterium]
MTESQGHHLVLGNLADFISGEVIPDTHDERYRQKLARLLVNRKGYLKKEIEPRRVLKVSAGDKCALVKIDYVVHISGRTGMIVRYGPGSVVTRRRPALAASRLVAPYQIPIVVVTNGEDAEVLAGASGNVIALGLESIPARSDLICEVANMAWVPISAEQAEIESRIVYAFEIDDSCPCDDTICRL